MNSTESTELSHSQFMTFCWDRARKETPELQKELISLEYVLTWGYSNNLKADEKRYKELQDIIYRK